MSDPTKLTTKLRFNLQYMTDETLESRYIAKAITVPSRYGWIVILSIAVSVYDSLKRKGSRDGQR